MNEKIEIIACRMPLREYRRFKDLHDAVAHGALGLYGKDLPFRERVCANGSEPTVEIYAHVPANRAYRYSEYL